MIALDLDDTVLQGTTGSTAALERAGQILECFEGQRHAADGGNGLAATAFAFAAHASNAIAFGDGRLLADSGIDGLAAVRAMPTCIGGEHQAAKGSE